MTPDQAKRVARRRKAALRQRARRIRVTVASLSATLFVTAFLVVYVQLASGHDPALSADSKRSNGTTSHVSTSSKTSEAASTEREQSASSSSSDAEEEATTGTTEEAAAGSSESTTSGEEASATSSEEPTPLTTSQS